MNKELNQKIKSASEQMYQHENSRTPTLRREQLVRQLAFRDGAEYLCNEGFRFTEEDMIDFVEYCHINAYKPEEVIGMYIKEREQK